MLKTERCGNRKLFASASGVSIVEALIASVILVIALIGFLRVAVSTTNLGGNNTKLASAISLATDKYERLILEDYDNVDPSIYLPEQNIDMDSQGNIIQGVFTRAITVDPLGGEANTLTVKYVTITVTWPGHTVAQKSIFMRR